MSRTYLTTDDLLNALNMSHALSAITLKTQCFLRASITFTLLVAERSYLFGKKSNLK